MTINRIDPFIAEPSLAALQRRNIPPEALLGFAVLAVVALIVSNATLGTLGMSELPQAICQDIGNLLRSSTLECLQEPATVAEMPFLRDIPSLVLLLAAAITPYLVYKQWTGFYDLVPTMSAYGLILSRDPAIDGAAALNDEVTKINQYIARYASSALVPGSVAAFAMACLMMSERERIYERFAPNNDEQWSVLVHSSWWANPANGAVNWIIYFMVGYVAVYYIVRMNLVGARVVLGIWRVHKFVRYGVDIDNVDGNYGWLPASRILNGTFTALFVHALGLMALLVMLDVGKWLLLVPLLGQFLVVLPFYTLIPLMVVARDIREFKRRTEAEILTCLQSTPPGDITQRTTFSRRLQAVRDLPLIPFDRWWKLKNLLTTAAGMAFGTWAVASQLWGISVF